jgi:hypothetical protein
MLNRVVLVVFVLSLCLNLPTFSQQNTEEELEEIEMQIAKYTKERNNGIVLMIVGAIFRSRGICGSPRLSSRCQRSWCSHGRRIWHSKYKVLVWLAATR